MHYLPGREMHYLPGTTAAVRLTAVRLTAAAP
jgi:hypothetical protein